MNKTRASMLLGLPNASLKDEELIQDAFDEEVFKITSFFLNRVLIPKLAQAKIKRLQSLNEAFIFLKGQEVKLADQINAAAELNTNSLIELIQDMQKYEMQFKLQLSQAPVIAQAVKSLTDWITLFESYAQAYKSLFPKSKIIEEANPSISRYVEYGEMLSQLKVGDYSGWAAQEYARLIKMTS